MLGRSAVLRCNWKPYIVSSTGDGNAVERKRDFPVLAGERYLLGSDMWTAPKVNAQLPFSKKDEQYGASMRLHFQCPYEAPWTESCCLETTRHWPIHDSVCFITSSTAIRGYRTCIACACFSCFKYFVYFIISCRSMSWMRMAAYRCPRYVG